MMRIHPFHAVRPRPEKAARVASLPYDVVTTDEARKLAAGNPHSFLHVVRSEIDLPEGADPYAEIVYQTARTNFDGLIATNVLFRDPQQSFFLYRQVRKHRAQIGLICCCHIDDYANDLIKKHEKTRKAKEDDRTRHVLTLNANTGPVFAAYRKNDEIDRLVQDDINERPIYHFNSDDGVTHTVWQVDAPDKFIEAFGKLPHAYVADGHHRAASAYRAGMERRKNNPRHTGEEEYNWFLCALFPHDQLTILPYNRVVKDLLDHDPDEILGEMRSVGTVSEDERQTPVAAGSFCFYMAGKWRTLTLDPATIDTKDAVESLDHSLLQNRVLEPILGITDQRTDDRIDFVGGIHGPQRLQQLVDSGDAAIAFSVHPVSMEQLMAVADAGLIMPPKCTWFEPKLRSGLFVHTLD